MRLSPKINWTAAQIDDVKQRVKLELEAALKTGGPDARLKAILEGIGTHEESDSPTGQLFLFVYIVSALVQHERFGGLTGPQINRIVNIAHAVLKFQGIQPETSKLGFLYGELHLALSQIHRREGDHWSACWEQQLASHLARRAPPGGEQFQNLSIAIRALRLGHGGRALERYTEGESEERSGPQFEKARIGRIRCLRLTAQVEKSREVIAETRALPSLSRRFIAEVSWEGICLDAASGDLSGMMATVQRGGEHYEAVYIAEAFLWANAVRELQYVERLPKMQTLARKKDIGARELGFFLKAALQLEACYDQATPYLTRLKALGVILGQVNSFVSIDREILFQLAATRWLARNHAVTLAATTLCEYQGTSLKLSAGRGPDALGIAGDLLEKSWFGGKAA